MTEYTLRIPCFIEVTVEARNEEHAIEEAGKEVEISLIELSSVVAKEKSDDSTIDKYSVGFLDLDVNFGDAVITAVEEVKEFDDL